MKRIVSVFALVMGLCLFASPVWGALGLLPRGEYDNRLLIITSFVIGTATVCGLKSDLYDVVIVGLVVFGDRPVIGTTLAVASGGIFLKPGDRFRLQAPVSCNGGAHVSLTLVPLRGTAVDEAERTGSVREGTHGPDAGPALFPHARGSGDGGGNLTERGTAMRSKSSIRAKRVRMVGAPIPCETVRTVVVE